MAEETTTPEETAPEAETPDEPFDAERAKAKIEKANREAAALRARLKEAEPYIARARELEEAQKTEQQRLAEQLAEAQKTAAERTTEALRLRIALKHGISDDDAETFLTGATEELMMRQAERLAAMRGPSVPAASGRTPVEALRPGALPNPEPQSLDDQITAAEKAKNWKLAMSLKSQRLAELAQKNR